MLSTAPPPRYTVQVLLPYSQALNPSVIHRQLLAWRSDVEPIGGSGNFGHFGFAIPTGDLPLLVHVFHTSTQAYAAQLEDAIAWSPNWPERQAAIDACTHSIVISMVAHRQVNHATMLLAFLSVLDAVLACIDDLRPVVLHWMPAQRVLSFAGYRMLRMEQGPCGPAINVRIAAISEHDMIADTVGLSGLGLPDLQAIVHDRDRVELTSQLVRLAKSMFVGDTLDCPWIEEQALVLPCRDAITVQLD